MAFVSNMDSEDQEKNASQGQVAPGGATNTVQTQPSAGVGSVGGGNSTGASNSQTGGGFASLNQYVNANQGQAQGLTNKITTGINDQYNTLQGQNQSTLQGIQGQVDQGYTKQNQALLDQEAAAPVNFANDNNNVSAFQGQLNDKYTGPQNAEGQGAYQNQLGTVNNAITQGKAATQTEAGRNQLLNQNQAVHNAGVTGLNSAILSNDPNTQAQIENAYNPFQNLVTGLNTGAQGIDTNISNATTEAQNASAAANKAITDQQTGLNTAVNQQLQDRQNAYISQHNDLANTFANLYGGQAVDTTPTALGVYGGGTTPWVNTTNYTVSPFANNAEQDMGINSQQAADLQAALQRAATTQKMFGHNFGAWSPTAQMDLGQFVKQGDLSQLTTGNTATADQYAQQQAFQKLLGSLPQGAVLDPTQANLAGTAPDIRDQFNYQNALDAAQQLGTDERTAGQNEANAITNMADKAHADSQHGGGFFNSLKNAITHPGTLLAMSANPLAQGANAARVLNGQNINPKDISAPGAKIVAPLAGGIVGAVYGGPLGAVAGASAGNQVGGSLQTLGGQTGNGQTYAFGGLVSDLEKNMKKEDK